MSFLNPWALLLLLTVPVLVLLYFLKLKRPLIRVASTLLWQKVVEDMRVNSPFQRLKRSLLLLLQLLALIAAILALARPLLLVRENVNESVIVLLDNSASMTAVEPGGKTRLELAKAEILQLADRLSKDDEMMVMTFNSKAEIVSGFTGNRRHLKNAIADVPPTDCPTRIEPALLLGKSVANSRGHPRLLLFSDGAFAAPEGIEMPAEIEYREIGTARPNLAITGLDIRRSLNDRNKIEMFVAVENFSDQAFSGNMAVDLDDQVLDSKYFSVAPKETLSQVFEAVLPAGGNIKVEFDADDALACDNRAWKIVRPPLHRRILVVGTNTFFVERAFKASYGIECRSVTESGYEDVELSEFSTVIWNGVANPGVAACDNIYLGCFPRIEGVTAGDRVASPDILDWDNAHPVNRFLDFDNLVLSAATSVVLPEYANVILRSSHTPLIALLETGRAGVCIVGFDPMQSNWPLLVSFPLFLNNCLNHFDEQRAKQIQANITVGGTITAPAASSAPVIQLPAGGKRTMSLTSSGEYCFTAVDKCGTFQIDVPGGAAHLVAVNLFDRNESLLDTVANPTIGGKAVKAVQAHRQVNREYWKYIVMAVAALLVVEWIVYHRRIFA